MKPPGFSHYQQLSRATFQLFLATVVFLALTIGAALAGWTRGVISLRSATASLACALAVLFSLYAVASLVRWIRRS